QHFLKDRSICRLIAETGIQLAREARCKTLLEIGPGRGALTDPLIELRPQAPDLERFVLAERDRALAAEWRARAVTEAIEEGDFLELPEEKWITPAPVAVVSNLPYSAGTAITTRLARHPDRIPFMVLMFQAEVAQRLRAEQGTKDWGSLSIWIQNRWDVRKLCTVPPSAFSPPPEVQSEVVVLTRRTEPRIAISNEALWEKLLKASFMHRRKMLRAGLRSAEPYRQALDASGLDATKRAEALSWEEWARFYRAVETVKTS
ncbi:MAG: 16S rRNA (adenine(1518)-N(6)/adenine(1519)-N(6))-dimethyltransferase RsmA, partial [Oligoflexia bacterium]|nr:16S rRNA (adenine(1518)-N(6)/adenine(1519)-N(6))-dimethyltransferase RsmA [Oligoflexia bacterium]